MSLLNLHLNMFDPYNSPHNFYTLINKKYLCKNNKKSGIKLFFISFMNNNIFSASYNVYHLILYTIKLKSP